MPLTPYLKEAVFDPAAIEAMNTAFTAVCESLQLTPRDDLISQVVARWVVDIGRTGERDPKRITELVLQKIKEADQRSA
jgi:hypothetical protein